MWSRKVSLVVTRDKNDCEDDRVRSVIEDHCGDIVHEQMQTDDETTAVQLHTLLNSKLFWRRVQQLSVTKETFVSYF